MRIEIVKQHFCHKNLFFFKIYLFIYLFIHSFIHSFIHDRRRERETETQEEGEAGFMQGARRGTRSRDSRIAPRAKGRRQTTEPPRDPQVSFYFKCNFTLHSDFITYRMRKSSSKKISIKQITESNGKKRDSFHLSVIIQEKNVAQLKKSALVSPSLLGPMCPSKRTGSRKSQMSQVSSTRAAVYLRHIKA